MLLVIEPMASVVGVTLNDQPVAVERGETTIHVDIAPLLQPANRLVIDVVADAERSSDDLPFSVQLAIVD